MSNNGSPTNQAGIQFTAFKSIDGKPQAKTIAMVEGALKKLSDSIALSAGTFEVFQVQSLGQFLGCLTGVFGSDVTLCYGVPVTGKLKGDVSTKGKLARAIVRANSWGLEAPEAISRSKAALAFRKGQPGIFVGDIDPDPRGSMKGWTAQQYDELLCRYVPWLRNVARGYLPSSGSGIYDKATGKRVDESEGWRLYFVVDDASLIPALGFDMFAKLVDANCGFHFVTTNGRRHVRTIVDRSVWQDSRLDFAFGSNLGAGLTQHRPVTFFEGLPMVRTAGMHLLADAKELRTRIKNWEKASNAFTAMMKAMIPEAKVKRAAWDELRVAVAVEAGYSEAEARSKIAAVDDDVLTQFDTLYNADGKPFTIRDAFANPAAYHGISMRSPADPEAGNTKAMLFLTDQREFPILHSFLHGGEIFRLIDIEMGLIPGKEHLSGNYPLEYEAPVMPMTPFVPTSYQGPRPSYALPPPPVQSAPQAAAAPLLGAWKPPVQLDYANQPSGVYGLPQAEPTPSLPAVYEAPPVTVEEFRGMVLRTEKYESDRLLRQIPLLLLNSVLNKLERLEVLKVLAKRSGQTIAEVRLAFRKMEKAASSKVVGMDGNPLDADKPSIRITAGQMPRMVREAEQALVDAGVAIYGRQSFLVRPAVEAVAASRKRKTQVPRLVNVKQSYLWNALAEHIEWERYLKTEDDWVPADPPKDTADVMLAREGDWLFPQITGLICCPTMLADGRLITREGFDEETGLLLWAPPEMPVIPDHPTQGDARAALALLLWVLDEFPFVDEVARSVALSALITPVLRGGMDTAPAHGYTARQAGTGKSYLQDLSAAICVGDLCPVMSTAKTEEENQKRLGAALMTGQPIISFDNVNGHIGFDLLCQAIDRPLVEVRFLGQSTNIKIPNRAVIFLNGNNMKVTGDMCRRVIVSTLDAGVERPELREFKGKPLDAILANRGTYVAAALTIARAYVVAGRPGLLKPVQSFGDWSDMVRSALVWLGMADPADAMALNYQEDPQRQTLSEFMQAFTGVFGFGAERAYKAADLIQYAQFGWSNGAEHITPPEGWHRAMAMWFKAGPQSFSKWLSSNQGKIVNGLVIEKVIDERNGHRWYIEERG